jgi:UDP-3-O-[3-hydroxymyristoyl] glucosamine N-acyltransferase
MEFTVEQIAGILGGEIEGNKEAKIQDIAKIQEAIPGTITFLANMKYEEFIYTTSATAVIVNKDFQAKSPLKTTLIRVQDAYSCLSILLDQYERLTAMPKLGVEEPAYLGKNSEVGEGGYRGAFSYIGDNVKIGLNVKIYPQVYVGDNVEIGDNCILFPGVKIYAKTKMGHHCTIQAGAVIGSDGFGFAPQADGSYRTVPQIGNVVLGNHVDIGANTTIDCATMGSTHIHDGVKLDNLIQIAHNVEIGKHTAVAAQAGISGSTKIGAYCLIGGQTGIIGHITIADKTQIGAQAGVMRTIAESGQSLIGSPTLDAAQYFKSYAVFRKLPSLQRKIEELEKKVLNLAP